MNGEVDVDGDGVRDGDAAAWGDSEGCCCGCWEDGEVWVDGESAGGGGMRMDSGCVCGERGEDDRGLSFFSFARLAGKGIVHVRNYFWTREEGGT